MPLGLNPVLTAVNIISFYCEFLGARIVISLYTHFTIAVTMENVTVGEVDFRISTKTSERHCDSRL